MATHDYIIANQGFPAFRSDLNDVLTSIVSNNSSATEPATKYAYMMWYDTTTNIWKMRNADNDAWISLATFDQATNTVNFLDSTISSPLSVTGTATAGAEIRLPEDTDNGANYIALKASDTIASNLTLTLPSTDGTTGQALTTNGLGVLSFGDVASDLTAVDSNIVPDTTDTYDLGTTSKVWRNIYTGDLHLSNESKTEGNSVDNTKGNWTIQEGAEDLYILNNKSGKKYKFKLEEI